MRLQKNRKGQNMAEYAILITIVVTAIVGMQIYVSRALKAKVAAVADNVGVGLDGIANKKQFEPYYAATDYTIGQDQNINEKYKTGGAVDRNSVSEKTTRTGTSTTGVDQGAGFAGWN